MKNKFDGVGSVHANCNIGMYVQYIYVSSSEAKTDR